MALGALLEVGPQCICKVLGMFGLWMGTGVPEALLGCAEQPGTHSGQGSQGASLGTWGSLGSSGIQKSLAGAGARGQGSASVTGSTVEGPSCLALWAPQQGGNGGVWGEMRWRASSLVTVSCQHPVCGLYCSVGWQTASGKPEIKPLLPWKYFGCFIW